MRNWDCDFVFDRITFKFIRLFISLCSRWQKEIQGIQSGLSAGPLVLFDKKRQTMIMGPFREFMSGSVHYNKGKDAIEWGVQGSATYIPKDYNFETAIVFKQGIKPVTLNLLACFYPMDTHYLQVDIMPVKEINLSKQFWKKIFRVKLIYQNSFKTLFLVLLNQTTYIKPIQVLFDDP